MDAWLRSRGKGADDRWVCRAQTGNAGKFGWDGEGKGKGTGKGKHIVSGYPRNGNSLGDDGDWREPDDREIWYATECLAERGTQLGLAPGADTTVRFVEMLDPTSPLDDSASERDLSFFLSAHMSSDKVPV